MAASLTRFVYLGQSALWKKLQVPSGYSKSVGVESQAAMPFSNLFQPNASHPTAPPQRSVGGSSPFIR